MIGCFDFYRALEEHGISFFAGVPDSLLRHFTAFLCDNLGDDRHLITPNEGNAVALAAGYHLATSKIGLVYMQNSGLGNAVNPLASLTPTEVYSIPLLLLIGWRGAPGEIDEPQHIQSGKLTLLLLDLLGIPCKMLSASTTNLDTLIAEAVDYMCRYKVPYALVVRKGTFQVYAPRIDAVLDYNLTREKAIELITGSLHPNDIVVCTTGKASRELFELRESLRQPHEKEFLTVGSMGHCSHIALGIALQKANRNVYCLDGDGALIMHMGSLTSIGSRNLRNLRHIVLNNGVHDSVGGQSTAGFKVDFCAMAKACGYARAIRVTEVQALHDELQAVRAIDGSVMLEIRLKNGSRGDLGRPTIPPGENKTNFMDFLR